MKLVCEWKQHGTENSDFAKQKRDKKVEKQSHKHLHRGKICNSVGKFLQVTHSIIS